MFPTRMTALCRMGASNLESESRQQESIPQHITSTAGRMRFLRCRESDSQVAGGAVHASASNYCSRPLTLMETAISPGRRVHLRKKHGLDADRTPEEQQILRWRSGFRHEAPASLTPRMRLNLRKHHCFRIVIPCQRTEWCCHWRIEWQW
jgi:hypothetical protein